MLSAGIDIGTTTTHLVISRIGIRCDGGLQYSSGVHITSKKVLFKSDVVFTALPDGKLTPVPLQQLLKNNIKKAGVTG